MKTYSFENLNVWQRGKHLSVDIYKITKSFPAEEKYGLTSQLRRASVSICSNLAEGTSRNSYKEKARFTEIAFGSLMEVLAQLMIANELGLLDAKDLERLRETVEEIGNKLNKLRISQLNSSRINT